MVLSFEIFVPATSTFEINRNGLISNNLLKIYEKYFLIMILNYEMIIFCKVYQIWWLVFENLLLPPICVNF